MYNILDTNLNIIKLGIRNEIRSIDVHEQHISTVLLKRLQYML